MMQSRYFSIKLVPNGGLKIDYFRPFSQFCTIFLQFLLQLLPNLMLKREPFCTKSSLNGDKTIIDAIKIFFFSNST